MGQPRFMPVGEYLPDQPSYQNYGCQVAENVIPRSASMPSYTPGGRAMPDQKASFSPVPSFVSSSAAALNGAVLGAFSAKDAAGNPGMYAGTATKLYVATNASKPNFADASVSGGYSTVAGHIWQFDEYQGVVFATNGTDPIQSIATATAGLFAPLSTSGGTPPLARCMAVIQPGFLLCGNIVDVTVGTQVQGVRWSSLGIPASFPPVGGAVAIANSSDWQNIPGAHGELTAIAANLASCNAALFFERAVYVMVFTGDTAIFNIRAVEKLRGTPAPQSVVQVGQVAYYLGYDGFYAFDGTQSIPVGEGRVNKTFLADCDPNFIHLVQGSVDPVSGICYWAYPSVGAASGTLDRILVYHTVLNRWSRITTTFGGTLFIGLSFGTSLDGIDALGYTLDTLPFSLDSILLTGGGASLAAFSNTNVLGFFSGPNMAFTVETIEQQLTPGARSRVASGRPIVEGDVASLAISGRNDLRTAAAYSTPGAPNSADIVPLRSENRYHRVQIVGAAANLVTHIQGVEVEFEPAGKR